MKKSLLNFKHIALLLVLFFTFFCGISQEAKQDTIALVKRYHKEALTSMSQQDYESAIKQFVKANKFATNIDDDFLRAEVKITSANLFYFLQDYNRAESEIMKAIAILKNSDNKNYLAQAYNMYGLVLTRIGNFEEAEVYANKANTIFLELKDEVGQAEVIFSLGLLESNKGNFKNAINYYDASIPMFKNSDLKYQESFALLNKAEAYLLLDGDASVNIEHAKKALNSSIAIHSNKSFTKQEITSHKIASEIALREQNFELAHQEFNSYTRQNDSLNQIFIKAISKGVDSETSVGDLKDIIETQKGDLDKKQRSINFGKMTTGLSIALIVILSLLTLSLYKNNNLRAKANELLQDKNNELQLAKEKAERASLAKAQFLSTITHELRTPLYAVTGLTHLLLEEDPKPDQKEHLNSLKFSGEYLLSLINNILDLNKLEANKVEVEKTTFQIKKRINDVLVALKKSAEDRKNNLHFEFDESIPEKLVGDPLKLSQILINLVGNSVKFTQNGDVHVRVSKADQNNDRLLLHFEIEDNGVGISKKKQKSIFETFSQASLQINRKFGGTGLGLSIVKNLLELMGSKIHLESQLGKGSKFSFDINFAISEEFQDTSHLPAAIEVDYADLENRNILVVEDNKINQMITKKILEKNKLIVQVADNGMDAIALVKENNFDVVLMDIHMPGISGIEATQEIRKFNSQLPIIALTAVTIDENLDDFYRAGFSEIIPKPFKTEEFFGKIYSTLQGNNLTVPQ